MVVFAQVSDALSGAAPGMERAAQVEASVTLLSRSAPVTTCGRETGVRSLTVLARLTATAQVRPCTWVNKI